MKRWFNAAGGIPLAVFLIVVLVGMGVTAVGTTTYVAVNQTVAPTTIYAAGTGSPDTAAVTITLTGSGPQGGFPIDCMLVIDTSATSDLGQTKQAAFAILNQLGKDDRAGLVVFSDQARLVVGLTNNFMQIKQAIADIRRGGKSALGDALAVARQELTTNGRPDAVCADILLSDGQSNVGSDAKTEGKVAAELGIKIISVGIGFLIDRDLLQQFAAETGGLFFPQPASTTAAAVISQLTVRQTATDITVTKILPAGLIYVSADPAPTTIVSQANGTTVLTWKLGGLGIGAHWSATINVHANAGGQIATDAGSTVSFVNFRGVAGTITIAPATITVKTPNMPPVAKFKFSPAAPLTKDTIQFTDESSDADGSVVAWSWDFGDGVTSTDQNPQHRYSQAGKYTVTSVVTDNQGTHSQPVHQSIIVANTPPTAMFTTDPNEPRTGVPTTLDASGSNDIDGSIVSYAWDFNGDGVIDKTTSMPQVTYTFPTAGEVKVTLVVTDNDGGTGTCTKTLTVLPSVTVTRTIDTCLPDDKTIAGGNVKVTVTITANTAVDGLSLSEHIPQSWSFTAVDNSSATLRTWYPTTDNKALECDWLFMETLKSGDKRVITYTLTAPTAPIFGAAGQLQVAINGTVASSSPRLTQMVLGEDKVTLEEYLPIAVVISRWDTKDNKIDLCLPSQISFDQIQYAVSLWLSNKPVPYTNGATIDLAAMRDLIAYWLKGISVHDPLP